MTNDTDIKEALEQIASALRWLGNGDVATRLGAIEFHATMVREGAQVIADAIEELADAIRELAPHQEGEK
jgi:hypothetical protein